MLGWIVWQERGKLRQEICCVRGVPFYRLETPPPRSFWQRRRFFRQVEEMRGRGVHQVVEQGEGNGALLWQAGLTAVEVAPLRLALLPQLLDYAQREWDIPFRTAAVCLRGKYADADTFRAAQILAHRVRYLHLTLEMGQEELEEALRRRYGLGIGGGRAALEVCIGVEGSGTLPALYLGRGCEVRQKVRVAYENSEAANEQLLSALFQAGKLQPAGFAVQSIESHA